MKKIAIVVVCMILLSMLSSCGGGTTETEYDPAESESTESETPREELPEELFELAKLRLENRDLSLGDLGALLSPPLSKSGVNHRLKRILAIAENL